MKTKRKSSIGNLIAVDGDSRKRKWDRRVYAVALWVQKYRGNTEEDFMPKALLEIFKNGDGTFYRKVGDALDGLSREGWHVAADGELHRPIPIDARLFIAICWRQWEIKKEKVEVRLAEIRQELGSEISKSRYFTIVKKLRAESKKYNDPH
jgi:hypothetical protein